ncbi:hypothetical protein [Kitasatospora sp. NPDC007106]|uniref:hypothetical protein n=1 Tax=Kitasatospora sp. NPDC007106 TaxID=3156914 RepID=UPI0033FCC168
MPIKTLNGASASDPARPDSGGRGRGTASRWTGAPVFAAVLLLAPVLLHLVSADLLTPLLLWTAAASLIRSRTSLLDRLFISAAVLVGWICVLGLIASFWPWGLDPLALAETTALALTGVRVLRGAPDDSARRRTRRNLLPARDVPVLLTSAFGFAFFLRPLLHRDAVDRLALVITSEDLGRHFALYDSMIRFSGYLALRADDAARTIQEGVYTYPPGSHMTLAVLTSFVRGTDAPAAPLHALSLFILLSTAVAGALVAFTAWAVRWAAGPAVAARFLLPVCLAGGVWVAVVELPRLVLTGFLSEIFGLALFAVFLALAVRPLSRTGEQLVCMGAVFVAIACSYYLLLPATGLVALVWAWAHRRRWLRQIGRTLLAAAAAGVLALLPIAANWASAGSASVLTVPGAVYPVSRHLLYPVLAVAAVLLLGRGARRNPSARVAAGCLAATGLLAFGIREYQMAVAGQTSYFFEKMMHGLFLATVVTAGAAVGPALLAASRRARPAGTGVLGRLAPAVTALVATACLLAALLMNSQPDLAKDSGWSSSAGRVYLRAQSAHPRIADQVTAIDRARPKDDGKVSMLLLGDRVPTDPARIEDNLWLGVLSRDQGLSWRAWTFALKGRTGQEIVDFADQSAVPLRIYLSDPELLAQVRQAARTGHHKALDVVMVTFEGHRAELAPQRLG